MLMANTKYQSKSLSVKKLVIGLCIVIGIILILLYCYKWHQVKEDEKYLLIYLEGARVNSSLWKAGKVKGILHPSHFKGIYEATWIDSQGLPLSHEIKAQEGEGDTLTFSFPYQSSTIRLRKIESR